MGSLSCERIKRLGSYVYLNVSPYMGSSSSELRPSQSRIILVLFPRLLNARRRRRIHSRSKDLPLMMVLTVLFTKQ